jgi:hypothetical protein
MAVRRAFFYSWALLACPAIACATAALWTNGKGGLAKFLLLFCLLPAILAAAAIRPSSVRRGDGVRGVIGAALMGLLGWFVIVAWIASGIHD